MPRNGAEGFWPRTVGMIHKVEVGGALRNPRKKFSRFRAPPLWLGTVGLRARSQPSTKITRVQNFFSAAVHEVLSDTTELS